MEHKRERIGIIFTVLGGICWGFSGVCGQYLLQVKGLSAEWLVSVRLLSAGLILLTFSSFRVKSAIWDVWKNRRNSIQMLLFGVLGMAACQYTYFAAVESSNAGTATVLQYTAPILIMGYMAICNRKMPTFIELSALVLALGGTFILATQGNIQTLAISKETLFFGFAAAITVGLYNIMPKQLMESFDTILVMGWGMIVGGVFLSAIVKPWHFVGIWDWQTVCALVAVIGIGTICAFVLYMEGVRLIGATKASLFASVEPVTATIAAVVWMGAIFIPLDIVGLGFILGAVLLLSLNNGKYEE